MKFTVWILNDLVALSLFGCAMAQSPVNGTLWSDVKSDGFATDAYGGTAKGEACASSILGLVAMGDSSIETAKRQGGVMQVTAVDHTVNNYVGFYAKYCTIVYGKRGGAGTGGVRGTPPPAPATAPAPPAEG
jgi:hypothetical protein